MPCPACSVALACLCLCDLLHLVHREFLGRLQAKGQALPHSQARLKNQTVWCLGASWSSCPRQTTICRAGIVARPERAEKTSHGTGGPLQNQFTDHTHEPRVCAHGRSTDHI